jgi:hypothetical protein
MSLVLEYGYDRAQIEVECKIKVGAGALTGIEPAGCQSGSVQLSLSSCVFVLVQTAIAAL